jgi:hypothetical protein
MTFDVIMILLAIVLAVIPCRLLLRIDRNLTQANRNLEQIASALQAKS